MAPTKRAAIIAALATVFFALDQASKWYAMDYLALAAHCPPGGPCFGHVHDVVPPYLRFVMAWNEGINFGLFSGGAPVLRHGLTAFAVIVGLGFLIYAAGRGGAGLALGAAMTAGGAFGNAYDRMAYGYVADFLNMSCCGFENPWSFNVADIAIFIGALGLIFLSGEAQKESAKSDAS